MTQTEAFIVALLLLAAATFVSRKYLGTGAQLALGGIATAAHLL
jgi:hypothetical protein